MFQGTGFDFAEASAREPRCSLIECCPVQEKGPNSSVSGRVGREMRETNRLIGVGEPRFSHQSGPGLGRFRRIQNWLFGTVFFLRLQRTHRNADEWGG